MGHEMDGWLTYHSSIYRGLLNIVNRINKCGMAVSTIKDQGKLCLMTNSCMSLLAKRQYNQEKVHLDFIKPIKEWSLFKIQKVFLKQVI